MENTEFSDELSQALTLGKELIGALVNKLDNDLDKEVRQIDISLLFNLQQELSDKLIIKHL